MERPTPTLVVHSRESSWDPVQALLDTTTQAVVLVDLTGRVLVANAVTAQRLRTSVAGLVGTNLFDHFPPEVRESRWARFQEMVASGRPLVFRDEREGRLYEHSLAPTLDDTGRMAGVGIFSTDITEAEAVRGRLRESEAQHRAVIETLADGFWIIDQAGVIEEVNDTYLRLSGYRREDLLGRPVTVVEVEEDEEAVRSRADRVLTTGHELFETRHRRRDGTVWPVEVNAVRWPVEGGRIFASLRDISTRQRSESLLRARLRLAEMADRADLDHLLQATLDEAELLTGSKIGFFHFVDPDQEHLTLQTWSTNTLRHACRAQGKGLHYPIHQAGVWADCFRTKAPVIHNDYASLPHRRGTPPDHAAVIRELTVPILRGNLVVAIMGVGNRPSDYGPPEVEVVQTLASLVMDLVDRRKAEESLRRQSDFTQRVFNSTDAHLAVVRADGTIQQVNDAWRRFARENNGGAEVRWGPGACYFRHCLSEAGDLTHAEEAYAGIREVQEGRRAFFELEYPCHSPTRRRWFSMRVLPLQGSPGAVLVSHLDVTLLKEAEERLRLQALVLDQIQDRVTVTDLQGRITYVNQAECRALGWSKEQIIGQSVEYYGEDPNRGATQREIVARTREDGQWRGEVVNYKADGAPIVLECRTTLIRDPEGRPVAMCGIGTDITGQKAAEAALRRLSQAVEQSPASVVITDLQGRIEYVNRRLCELTGFTSEELQGVNPRVFQSGQTPQATYREMWGNLHRGAEWTGEVLNRKKNGELYWERMVLSSIRDPQGHPTHFLGIKEDVTEQKRAEEALRSSRAQLRALAGRVQSAREEERIRLAREIHDVLAQELTGLKIDQAWLVRQLSKAPLADHPQIPERLAGMNRAVDTAIQSVQKIATELRPIVLDTLGLTAAVEWQAREFSARCGLGCHLELPEEDGPLSRAAATAAYRVLQESLTNVARHARAGQITVTLRWSAEQVILIVGDDGQGIDPAALEDPNSIGLTGMRERALLLGGSLDIRRQTPRGTTVELRLPQTETSPATAV